MTATNLAPAGAADWPALPLAPWQSTLDTLHMWTQIVGKTRLALAPMANHWWQIVFYASPRGLTTSCVPAGASAFDAEFDFIDHALVLRTSAGAVRRMRLEPRSVADFYAEYTALLHELGVAARIRPVPVEVVTAVPFPADREHASYDADAANRWWRVLAQSARVLERYRSGFLGKQSPVHFFWGSFDLAATRFSGRPAPRHPGGAPNCPDYVMVEAYSHECCSVGFWPGGGAVAEPAYYAYAYPEPAGYADHPVGPAGASYNRDLREFILPYEAVRTSATPDDTLLAFAQSTYVAAADLARWERAALERPSGSMAHGGAGG